MDRRDISKFLLGTVAGSVLLDQRAQAQGCVAPCYPQTPIEATAGITPVDTTFPPGHVFRYGAVGDGSTDDLPAFQMAHDALGTDGGILTGPALTYLFVGTLSITGLVCVDFGTNNNGGATSGAIFKSVSNATLISYPNTANRFVWLRNVSLLGQTGAGLTGQHGIVVNNGGVRMQGVSILACGGSGIIIQHSFSSNYNDIYISLCDGNGVLVSGACGANTWKTVSVSACGNDGWNIDAANGSDYLIGCISEQNGGYGLSFGGGVEGWNAVHTYTEANNSGTALFKSGSDKNHIHYNSWSDSTGETDPINNGGTENIWSGRKYLSDVIGPKLIQRVYTEYSGASSGSPNAIPYDDTKPQSNEGLTVMSRSITPKRSGNKLKVKVSVNFSYSAGSIGSVTLFIGSATDAAAAKAAASGVNLPIQLDLEYEHTVSSTSGITFSVNVGSNSSATITFNGTGAARKFGGIACSTISVEEFWPSS